MRYYYGDNGNNTKTASKTSRWYWTDYWESWTMYGRGGNDNLTGGPLNDFIYGEEGNDTLNGGGGDDYLYGGSEDDYLNGGDGHDVLYGESGYDTLLGGTGNDYLSGGDNSDTLNGYGRTSSEYDTLIGGSGADTFVLGSSDWGVFYLGSGYATITDFNWTESDQFQVIGNINNYSLGTSNWSGSSALDTGIYYNSDLIAVVQDRSGTDVILAQYPNGDFNFV